MTRHSATRMGASKAFTLVEVLVVIGILGLLAALVFSALTRARHQSQATLCRNNLAQLVRAMEVYRMDFGAFPGTAEAPSPLSSHSPADWKNIWTHRLLSYVGDNSRLFDCPSDQPPKSIPSLALTNFSYGYNAYGSGEFPVTLNLGLGRAQAQPPGAILPVAEVEAPSDMIAIGDLTDIQQLFTTCLRPNGRPPYAGGPASRHNGGANMAFCDGHSEFGKQTVWVAATIAARQRWNNDHKPHTETW